MAYHFSFADNESYSAEDVNNITKRLVTKGIEDHFQDGVPYNLSDINEAGTHVYTEGVVPETVTTLKVTVDGESVFIHPGMAFFADGAVIEIEDGGHTLSKIPGAINYVYLKNDLVNANACYPVCSAEEPTGDFVLLAEISENGTVTDKRTYAKGKLPGYASNALSTMKITENFSPQNLTETMERSFDIGNNNYRYLFVLTPRNHGSDYYVSLGVYDFTDGSYVSFCGNQFSNPTSYHCFMTSDYLQLYRNNGSYADATVDFSNGVLTLHVTYRAEHASHIAPFTVTMYLV